MEQDKHMKSASRKDLPQKSTDKKQQFSYRSVSAGMYNAFSESARYEVKTPTPQKIRYVRKRG
ncbi:MAG TPA: hypothetical protein VLG11_01250 [Candidatus Saccharimonadales bacterium]|nr:hypothetical protein [Candidatus Saccharimonadales bacterium]